MNTKANWTKVALLAGMSVAAVSLVGCSADGDKPDPNLRTPYQGKPIDDGISLYDENVNSVVGDDQERCGLMYNYVSLVDCKGKNPDFIAAVNRHSAKLKMDWDRILYWSGKCKTEDARAILVSARTDVDVNTERGRKEVRDKLRGVWGDDVDRMPVLQQQDSIVNTMEQDQMVPFHDETPQIRVTLVPLKDDCNPDPASIEGIMADCLNGWWLEELPPPGPPPASPPPDNPPGNPPEETCEDRGDCPPPYYPPPEDCEDRGDCPPPPPPPPPPPEDECPPGSPLPHWPCFPPPDEEKDPNLGSYPNGNSPDGGPKEQEGPGEELPPDYAPEEEREDPPPPAPTPGEDGGTPTSVQAPPPGPGVTPDPGTPGSQDGAVEGPSEGEEEFVPPADW